MDAQHAPTDAPKFSLDLEGQLYEWHDDVITTEQLIALAGWPGGQQVIEIDKDQGERTLQPGEVISLKPGHGFAKKIRWKRGQDAPGRVDQELALLRTKHPDLSYVPEGRWVRLPSYVLPQGWNRPSTDIAFQIPSGYPGAPPYGFYAPVGLRFNAAVLTNYTEPAATSPPFTGQWGFFSWASEGEWRPTANLLTGPNLYNFALGFADRFRQGA